MRRNRVSKAWEILAWLFIIAGVVGGLYIGGWIMFIQPIIEACKHFDAGTLTGVMVGVTILKCIFASTVGSLIIYVSAAIAKAVWSFK
jgi:hypothetical protein